MIRKYIKTCLYILDIYIILEINCVKLEPKFCDTNYIDAVLWDGIRYRVTRNEWIANYDESLKTIGQFVHKNVYDFPYERNLNYQSGYHISKVPECDHSMSLCQEIQQLIGLTVYTIRDSITGNTFYRTTSNTNKNSIINELNKNYLFDYYLSPKMSKHSKSKYHPSVYNPNEYMFIHISNSNENSIAIIETIELRCNGVIEKNYYDLIEPKNMIFITMFWWKFDQNVYVVAEDDRGFGKAFIFVLLRINQNFFLKPFNISVIEFFGCNKQTILRSEVKLYLDIIKDNNITNNTELGISLKRSPNEEYSNQTNGNKLINRRHKDIGVWKISAIILFWSLLILSILLLLIGIILFLNLRKILSKTTIRRKSYLKKFITTEFLLEKYENSPKALNKHMNKDFVCQTIQRDVEISQI